MQTTTTHAALENSHTLKHFAPLEAPMVDIRKLNVQSKNASILKDINLIIPKK